MGETFIVRTGPAKQGFSLAAAASGVALYLLNCSSSQQQQQQQPAAAAAAARKCFRPSLALQDQQATTKSLICNLLHLCGLRHHTPTASLATAADLTLCAETD